MPGLWERPLVHHVIDGASVPSIAGDVFPTVNPSSGRELTQIALGRAEDVDRAVDSAWGAFERGSWSRIRPADRARRLRDLAAAVEQHSDELAELDAIDGGGPISQRRADVAGAVEMLHFASSLGEHMRGAVYPDETGYLSYSQREPYGVVAAIAPWNFPFYFAVAKTAAALATGNSVVLKMAEQTPLSAVRFGELAQEAGIPAGVLNVVNGDAVTGRLLAEHPRVPKITFTGSTEVGRAILRSGSERIASTHLELGGKSANIVFADADLEQAIDGSLFTSFFNSGQVCTSGSRLMIERPAFERVIDGLLDRIPGLVVGDPLDETTQLGPLVSAGQLARIEGMVQRAFAQGATAIVGGGRLEVDSAPGGFYYAPTLLTDVTPEMEIACEEVFGPVTSVFCFDREEEAVALANGVDYGLAATLWTTDLRRAARVAERLSAGIIWTNAPHHEASHIPYEGHKLSGLGEDQGAEAIATFTQLKVNHVAYSGRHLSWGA